MIDVLSAHSPAAVCIAFEIAGAEMRFQPPNRPDFKPIEMVVSKLEAVLKKTAKLSITALWIAISDVLLLINPNDCATVSNACSYDCG